MVSIRGFLVLKSIKQGEGGEEDWPMGGARGHPLAQGMSS